jgi:hypothetical protein
VSAAPTPEPRSAALPDDRDERIARLERAVEDLHRQFDAFRKQFE